MESLRHRAPYKNMLLASLPPAEIARLAKHLVRQPFQRGEVLYEAGEKVTTVYFPEEGIGSLIASLQNGSSVEVGLIGRDSFMGAPAVLGSNISSSRCVIQIAGCGYGIKAQILMEEAGKGSGEIRACLLRGLQGQMTQTSQTAACNRVHSLEERLARWLLMCHDRVQNDSLITTHEFLSIMLGTNRSSVTLALGILSKAGLIEPSRGQVRVVNRRGLEAASCECYATVQAEYVRLGLL